MDLEIPTGNMRSVVMIILVPIKGNEGSSGREDSYFSVSVVSLLFRLY